MFAAVAVFAVPISAAPFLFLLAILCLVDAGLDGRGRRRNSGALAFLPRLVLLLGCRSRGRRLSLVVFTLTLLAAGFGLRCRSSRGQRGKRIGGVVA
ncbi:hypothetical protein [Oryzomonas japonica]|uniref:hypothetical protein n=1 Tax=Oryzomonas japonica TaxID=2603858 RepID=UPI001FE96195|nr:hypothetical protein [Oryzomonas japonica]